MTTEPNTIPFAVVNAALEQMGIVNDNDILRVTIEPQGITVERYRRDKAGRVVIAGNHIATVTTVIGIDHKGQSA